ncbi:MAG: universal stress protein [Cyclobacteriaceae bacterium]
MKKIVVPIDFSDVSKLAVEFAVELAQKSKSEIILLHAVQFDNYYDELYGTNIDFHSLRLDVRESIEKKMKGLVKNLITKITINTRIIEDLTLLEAVRYTVDFENVGLVILGTTGSSGLSEFLVGSNTEKIIRRIECPVISVPSKTSFDSIKNILAPIDPTEVPSDFLAKLVQLQKLFSAKIEFLWVRTPHNIENINSVKKEFLLRLKEHRLTNFSFDISNRIFPADGIMDETILHDADMIAMATHARKGISHLLSGSITEDTVNHVNVPVWTFKLKNDKGMQLSDFVPQDSKMNLASV